MAAPLNHDMDFSEFCETLREKYDMTEADWMALLITARRSSTGCHRGPFLARTRGGRLALTHSTA